MANHNNKNNTHEKIHSIISYHKNTNKSHNEIHPLEWLKYKSNNIDHWQ